MKMRQFIAALAAAFLFAVPAHGQMLLRGVGNIPAAGGGGPIPVFAWFTTGAISTSSTSAVLDKGANSISAGDLLVFLINMSDNSGTDHNLTCPSGTTPFSWSDAYDASGGFNFMGCWKIATGSEPANYTATWTTGNTQAAAWVLAKYTGANATTPIEATAIQAQSTTSPVTPTVTSGGSNRLLVSCIGPVGSSNSILAFDASTTSEFAANPGALVRIGCAGQTVGSGATGTRTHTTNQANPVWGMSFLVQP